MRFLRLVLASLFLGLITQVVCAKPPDPVAEFIGRSLDDLTAYCFWINNQIYMRRQKGEFAANSTINHKQVDDDANYFIKLHNRHVLNTAETRRIHKEAQQLVESVLRDDVIPGMYSIQDVLETEHARCSLERTSLQLIGGHKFSEEAKKLRR
jgi:hypothetical protein